jgi:hypothetical protein
MPCAIGLKSGWAATRRSASGESEITRWGARRLMETDAIDFLQHEPHIHGHLLASVPNGYMLESFANPEREPLWFELYTRRPKIEKVVLYLDDLPGLVSSLTRKLSTGTAPNCFRN